jgi:hypothetical protein
MLDGKGANMEEIESKLKGWMAQNEDKAAQIIDVRSPALHCPHRQTVPRAFVSSNTQYAPSTAYPTRTLAKAIPENRLRLGFHLLGHSTIVPLEPAVLRGQRGDLQRGC